jgi:hypothetical protein
MLLLEVQKNTKKDLHHPLMKMDAIDLEHGVRTNERAAPGIGG